jgi:hypothetical protein
MAGHWAINGLANPVLRRLLRTPLGRFLGRSLAVLRYTGTRTGMPHELVCRYVRDGDHVWILAGRAERKIWWRNLRSPSPVELWLAGRRLLARAVAVTGRDDPVEGGRGLAAYAARLPRAGALPIPDVVLVRADVG